MTTGLVYLFVSEAKCKCSSDQAKDVELFKLAGVNKKL
jgi:hypothetical protein